MPENLIMVGPTRTGTTSLFRFLGAEPRISLSKKKETDYFYRAFDSRSISKKGYLQEFSDSSTKSIALEASPLYFMAGEKIARSIRETLIDVKVIIILRNPIDRFFSIYKHILDKRNLGLEVDIQDFFSRCVQYDRKSFSGKNDINSMSFYEGAYVDLLEGWTDIIGIENTFVTFYETLFDTNMQHSELTRLFDWLGLGESALLVSRLPTENIGRSPPSSKLLHRIALHTNDQLEPILNAHPLLRSALRSLYYSINSQSKTLNLRTPDIENAVTLAYNEENRGLPGVLEKVCPQLSFPPWVYGTSVDPNWLAE